MRYEVIESRRWKNDATGATASLYGACPWISDQERQNWRVETVGFTWRNLKTGTIGLGRAPAKTREEADSVAKRLNNR